MSGTFVAADLFTMPILTDAHGDPVEPNALPCYLSADWDTDQPVDVQVAAAARCRAFCPALTSCYLSRRQLGRAASGVWAGRIIPGPNAVKSARPEYAHEIDRRVANWLRESGIPAPTPPTRKATP